MCGTSDRQLHLDLHLAGRIGKQLHFLLPARQAGTAGLLAAKFHPLVPEADPGSALGIGHEERAAGRLGQRHATALEVNVLYRQRPHVHRAHGRCRSAGG